MYAHKKRSGAACSSCKYRLEFEFCSSGCKAIAVYWSWLSAVADNGCLASFSEYAPDQQAALQNCAWSGICSPITGERVYKTHE